MIVSLKSGQLTNGAPYWCKWTQMYFTEMYDRLERKNIFEKDGSLDEDIKELLKSDVLMGYSRLNSRFNMDEGQMEDERETLLRLMNILPAQEYIKMAKLIIEPYTKLELDKKSLDRLKSL